MLKNTTMLFHNLKSIFLLPLWLVLGLLCASTLAAFWLILTILYLLFFLVIWPLAGILLKGLALGLMQVESVGLIQGLGAVRSNIQELFHSLKSLKQQSNVAPKMVLEVVVQRFTSLYGTRKLKILSYLKTIKDRKTTE